MAMQAKARREKAAWRAMPDGASKANKFERVPALLVCSALPAFIMLVTTDKGSLSTSMSMPSLLITGALYVGYFAFLAYAIVRLLLRSRQVRAPQQMVRRPGQRGQRGQRGPASVARPIGMPAGGCQDWRYARVCVTLPA